MTFGPWMLKAMKMLARLKFLRGGLFDPFGYTRERAIERRLVLEYESTVQRLLINLEKGNHPIAVAIARIPEQIRGFGDIKLKAIGKAKELQGKLLRQFEAKSSAETSALVVNLETKKIVGLQ